MAQKSILSWISGKSGSDVTETGTETSDSTASEPGTDPPKKKQKFEHLFQEKWLEKWPFLRKTDKGMLCQTCVDQKKRNALTEGCINYRTSTIERHLATQDHQDALKEEAMRNNFSEVLSF